MLGGPHVFHLTNVINRIFVLYYKDGRNNNDRQIRASELFLLITEFKDEVAGTRRLSRMSARLCYRQVDQ